MFRFGKFVYEAGSRVWLMDTKSDAKVEIWSVARVVSFMRDFAGNIIAVGVVPGDASGLWHTPVWIRDAKEIRPASLDIDSDGPFPDKPSSRSKR